MTAPRIIPAIRTHDTGHRRWHGWVAAAALIVLPFASCGLVWLILDAGIQWRTAGAYVLGVAVGAVAWVVHGAAKTGAAREEYDAWNAATSRSTR